MWQASGLAAQFAIGQIGNLGWIVLGVFGLVQLYLHFTLFMVRLSVRRFRAATPAILSKRDLEVFGEKAIRFVYVSRLQHYALAVLLVLDLLAHFVGIPMSIAIVMWAATAIPVWVGRRVRRSTEEVLELPTSSSELGQRYREVCEVWRRNAFPAWLGERS